MKASIYVCLKHHHFLIKKKFTINKTNAVTEIINDEKLWTVKKRMNSGISKDHCLGFYFHITEKNMLS